MGLFVLWPTFTKQSLCEKLPLAGKAHTVSEKTVGTSKWEFCVMTTNRTIQIYQLIDPRTGQVFYVGQTMDAEKRLSGHIRDAIDTEKRIKIKDILAAGEQPQMVVIANVPEHVANDYEKLIIKITDGLTNTAHNVDRGANGSSLATNGERVGLPNSEEFAIIEKAIREHYNLVPGDRRHFVTTKDAFDYLGRYCSEGTSMANKMLIGKVMVALGITKTKRRVNKKRQHVYEGITLKNTGE